MVRWIRTAKIKDGKFMEMIAWSKEIVAFLKKHPHMPEVHTFLDLFGATGTIRWMTDYPDMAALEKVQSQIMDNKVRVTGKKLDELQAVIAHLKEHGPEYPLQFNNFT